MLRVPRVCHAQRPASDLRPSSPALYHYLVLPAIARAAHRAQPQNLPFDSGTDALAAQLQAFVVRALRKECEERAPTVLAISARPKAWATHHLQTDGTGDLPSQVSCDHEVSS